MKSMKRIIAVMVSLVLILALAGCGSTSAGSNANTEKNNAKNETSDEVAQESADADPASNSDADEDASDATDEASSSADETTPSGDTLVIYFSRTGEQYGVGVIDKGNTEIVAEMIAEGTSADLYEIVPEDDYYPTTYDELTDIAKQEQNDNARPAYADTVPDLTGYSTIFIGAPVWWGDWPMIMYTFFEQEDLSGKTLIPFATHAGSGLSGFDKKLSAACPDSEVSDGLAVAGTDAQNDPESVRTAVSDWLSGMGY